MRQPSGACHVPPGLAVRFVLATTMSCCLPAMADDACATLDRTQMLQQVNAARAQGAVCGAHGALPGAAPLQWNDRLQRAAQAQAQWLAERGALSHTGPQGESLRERAGAAGYAYAHIAENVAAGQRSVAQVLAGWTASEGHCVNLYDAGVTEMALACVPGRGAKPYWALLLARPP